jgi:ketosteroid isomerase-like protein
MTAVSDETSQVVLDLDEQRWEAIIAGDADTLRELFADELVYTHSNGMVDNKQSYLAAIESGAFRYHRVARAEVELHRTAVTTIVTGWARIDTELNGSPLVVRSRYSAVWALLDTRWRLVGWHSCPVAGDE